jgi:hypothetical protein
MVDRTEFEADRAAGLKLRHELRLARAEVRIAVRLANALGRKEAAEEIAEAVRAVRLGPVTEEVVLAIAEEVGARGDGE